jgi:hypothetical protein
MTIHEELEKISAFICNHPDHYYKNIYDFCLKEGKISKSQKLTSNELEIVNDAISNLSRSPEERQCFYNAQRLCVADLTDNILYEEGYCKINKFPFSILHGWNSINGKLIDITFKTLDGKLNKEGKYIIGIIPEDFTYLGTPFSKQTILKNWSETGYGQTLLDDPYREFPFLQKKYIF